MIELLAIAELDADRDAALAELTPRERVRWDSLRLEKQRREHLAGRLAAKRAAARLLGADPREVEILRSEAPHDRGRPYVAGAPGLSISISHTADLAAAAAARVAIGIDLERVEPREPSFEALFLDARERAALAALTGVDRDRAVTFAWCVKEAAGKQLGLGLSIPFADLTVPEDSVCERHLLRHGDTEHALAVVYRAQPISRAVAGPTTHCSSSAAGFASASETAIFPLMISAFDCG
jgi:4'-phosphopantetheinyl transferase